MREVQVLEVWKDIIGFEEYYEISNLANVKSKSRIVYDKNGIRLRENKPKIMKQYLNRYYFIGLNKNGKQYNKLVHRLVAEHFIPNPENKPCINYKDGNKLNNHVNNLEWCTYSENTQHACDTGLKTPTFPKGTTPPQFEKNKSRFKKGEIPWNKGKRQKPPTHGTLYEYFKGCRCNECKKANTEYCAKKRLG